tara:strand:- start:27423 stop:28019 length:597 start_codon:yes stop_codon:yes gene_type:complete
MYGSRTNQEGVAISANGSSPILVGEKVTGNKLVSLEMAKDQNGNPVENRATLTILQRNGAKFTHSFWDSTEEWAIVQVNREMLHMATKIVTEDEYYAVIEEHGDNTFKGFIKAVAEHILPKAAGKTFSMKIIYKENKSNGKWYPNFPKFPNFIELDGTEPSTFSTNPKYDVYTMPTPTTMDSTPTAAFGSEESTEVVF